MILVIYMVYKSELFNTNNIIFSVYTCTFFLINLFIKLCYFNVNTQGKLTEYKQRQTRISNAKNMYGHEMTQTLRVYNDGVTDAHWYATEYSMLTGRAPAFGSRYRTIYMYFFICIYLYNHTIPFFDSYNMLRKCTYYYV